MRPDAVIRQMMQSGRLSELTDAELDRAAELAGPAEPVLGAGAPGEQIKRADVPQSMLPPPDRTGTEVAQDIASNLASTVLPLLVPGSGAVGVGARIASAGIPEAVLSMWRGDSAEDAAVNSGAEMALQGLGEAGGVLPNLGVRGGLALKGVPKPLRRRAAQAYDAIHAEGPQIPGGLGPARMRIPLGGETALKEGREAASKRAVEARRAVATRTPTHQPLAGTRMRIRNVDISPTKPISDRANLAKIEERAIRQNRMDIGPDMSQEQLGELTSRLQATGRKPIEAKITGQSISPGRELESKWAAEAANSAREELIKNVPGEAANRESIRNWFTAQDASKASGGDIGALNKLGTIGMGGGTGSGTARAAAGLMGFDQGLASQLGSLLGMILLNPQNLSRAANITGRGLQAAPMLGRGTMIGLDTEELLKMLQDDLMNNPNQ